jgi:hypothetical protein
MDRCVVCGIELEGKKPGTKTCSPRCRVTLSRTSVTKPAKSDPSVTEKGASVTLKPSVTDAITFQFAVVVKPDVIRSAKYWYDVPLAAIPKLAKGWPPMPSYMTGRQYFLWWKNNFAVNNKQQPVILSPIGTK